MALGNEKLLSPWINRTTWQNYTFIGSCKINFLLYKVFSWKFRKCDKRQWSRSVNFFLGKILKKNAKTYRQLELNVKFFSKFSPMLSWQMFFIVFFGIFQISRKTFCKIKKFFYTKLVISLSWSAIQWKNLTRGKIDIHDQYLDIQLCGKHLTYSVTISKYSAVISKIFILRPPCKTIFFL